MAIFEATPDPYLILNQDLCIVAVNDAYLSATSTARDQIIGRGIFDVFPDNPNDPNASGVRNLKFSLEKVIDTKKPHRMALQKYDIPVPGGRPIDFEERYWSPLNTPVINPQGEVSYVIHHVEDVTEMVRARLQASKLEESEARFRQIANAMPQSVWTVSDDGTVNWCNDWWFSYTGVPRNASPIDWLSVFHADDRSSIQEARDEAIREKDFYTLDARIRNAAGSYRWHQVTIRPVKDGENLLEWVGLAVDINELTLAKERIQEEEAKFRAIANAVPQIVWSTLPDGYHDYFNERYYEYTGATPDTMFGEAWIVYHHPDDRDRLKRVWGHSLATGAPYEIEYRMKHHSGNWRWVLGRALPVRNKEGEIVRWFGTCTDIHEQKQTQTALKEAIRDREMFVSMASHELKSPLTALGLQTQLQLRKLNTGGMARVSEENFRNTLGKINQLTERLTRLVDEMLDLSRITSGRLSLQPRHCNICDLLQEVLARISPQFQKANVPMPELKECNETWGNWDSFRLEQVITNLLTNALRYGNGRPVRIKLEDLGSFVRFSVKDEGIGIAEEARETVFNRFERATNTGKGQGLGLGLYITKEIVIAHKGKIWVDSAPGEGSTFYVELSRNPDYGTGGSYNSLNGSE